MRHNMASGTAQGGFFLIRVRGVVQGVGFRPTVFRLAGQCRLTGSVKNDSKGVLIHIAGEYGDIEEFCGLLKEEAPPLSRIDALEIIRTSEPVAAGNFAIEQSSGGKNDTGVVPDASICTDCAEEITDPYQRRFRYPFANCTHCGPRFTIIEDMPYDRTQTTMRKFSLCEDCIQEFADPDNRRFHAQPIACHKCGPGVWLKRLNGGTVTFDQHSMLDCVDAAASLIQKGEIVIIRSLGGFHIACDAMNVQSLERLRKKKRRNSKPFALMARDIEVVRRFCSPTKDEIQLLLSREAPIVLMKTDGPEKLPDIIAPGLDIAGFMLPFTPLHMLLFRRLKQPVVMTSGNFHNEPQITDNDTAEEELRNIADYGLFHDRDIANRVDDSVIRVIGNRPRLLRRARGFTPGAIPLPEGFQDSPDIIAVGGDLKSAFCMVKNGEAIISQHQGDLEEASTYREFQNAVNVYSRLFDHEPRLIAADRHPGYFSRKLAESMSSEKNIPLTLIQHHHAHIASCMAENGFPLNTEPVLGVVLDGTGYGDHRQIWGGEFLLADYREYRRLGTFRPVPLPGGSQAVLEPWRNTYAHIVSGMGWDRFVMNFGELDICGFLSDKPREVLDRMIAREINSVKASSCGRLFDAVAAAIGFARERAEYEGRGAMMLEAVVCSETLSKNDEESAYPFSIPDLPDCGLPYIEPIGMWQALFGDMILETPASVMSARFHKGLALAIVSMVRKIAKSENMTSLSVKRIMLTGGCFQNKILFELTQGMLQTEGFHVFGQSHVPANDGGLALGQAAIAAAGAVKSEGGGDVSRYSRTDN